MQALVDDGESGGLQEPDDQKRHAAGDHDLAKRTVVGDVTNAAGELSRCSGDVASSPTHLSRIAPW